MIQLNLGSIPAWFVAKKRGLPHTWGAQFEIEITKNYIMGVYSSGYRYYPDDFTSETEWYICKK